MNQEYLAPKRPESLFWRQARVARRGLMDASYGELLSWEAGCQTWSLLAFRHSVAVNPPLDTAEREGGVVRNVGGSHFVHDPFLLALFANSC